MKLIPAIDLMEGNVVRLHQGESNSMKQYDSLSSPVDIARRWVEEGAELLHIIDLDAAFGRGDNMGVIREISSELGTPIQLGGGIRSEEKARDLLDTGIYRVIIGSMAVRNPEAVYRLLDEYDDNSVSVALDHRNGLLAIDGWRENTGTNLVDAITSFIEKGVKVFLVTSVEKDGTLKGPDVENLGLITKKDATIIAAGGVGSLADLQKLKNTGVSAAVIGKALYEGCFTLREAIESVEVTLC